MTIENNIKKLTEAQERTANALEKLVEVMSGNQVKPVPTQQELPVEEKTVPVPPVEEKTVPVPPTMTVEELNAALVVEHGRIGDQQRILAVLNGEPYGAAGVRDLDPSQYQAVLDDVRALEV